MFGKKQQTIDSQTKRIEDLEFALCKGKHDFVEIGQHALSAYCNDGYIDRYTEKRYKCHRCGKVITKTDIS